MITRLNPTSPWDTSENELFLDVYRKCGKHWTIFATVFNALTKTGYQYNGDQCMRRYRVFDPELVRGVKWSAEDDELLRELVQQQLSVGQNIRFDLIASQFPGRDTTQCRNRYHDYVDPALDRSPLRDEEIEMILEGKQRGEKWAEIRAKLPTKRSSNTLRNFWSRKTLKSVTQNVENDRERLFGKRHRAYKLEDIPEIVSQYRAATTPCSSTASTPSPQDDDLSYPPTPKRRRGDSDVTDTSSYPSTPLTPSRPCTRSSSLLDSISGDDHDDDDDDHEWFAVFFEEENDLTSDDIVCNFVDLPLALPSSSRQSQVPLHHLETPDREIIHQRGDDAALLGENFQSLSVFSPPKKF